MLNMQYDSSLRRVRRVIAALLSVDMGHLGTLEAKPWASATFEGTCYRLTVALAADAEPAGIVLLQAKLAQGGWLPENQVAVDVCARVEPASFGHDRCMIVEILALHDVQ